MLWPLEILKEKLFMKSNQKTEIGNFWRGITNGKITNSKWFSCWLSFTELLGCSLTTGSLVERRLQTDSGQRLNFNAWDDPPHHTHSSKFRSRCTNKCLGLRIAHTMLSIKIADTTKRDRNKNPCKGHNIYIGNKENRTTCIDVPDQAE